MFHSLHLILLLMAVPAVWAQSGVRESSVEIDPWALKQALADSNGIWIWCESLRHRTKKARILDWMTGFFLSHHDHDGLMCISRLMRLEMRVPKRLIGFGHSDAVRIDALRNQFQHHRA